MVDDKKEEKYETQYCNLSPDAIDFIMAFITMSEEDFLAFISIVESAADNRETLGQNQDRQPISRGLEGIN